MSFYFRDKPKFSDRLRGKSGDELLQEIKQQFDEDSKSFFEPATRSGRDPFERHSAFSRGFPFDDESFGRRSDIRAHLDDLAARHPEFADQLLGPPWGDIPFQSSFRNRNRGSGNGAHSQQQHQPQGYSDEDARSQASGSSAASGSSSHGEAESNQNQQSHTSEQIPDKKNQIPQYGLRNTVDIGQHHHDMENADKGNRGQRSMSAPPENRQPSAQQQQQPPQPQQQEQQSQQPSGQRYVSRIDITPQHNQPSQQQPQQQQPQQQQQQPQKPQQQGNVRHIPIFVEGRDEPVLPRSFDEPSNFKREPSPTQFHAPPHFQRSSPFSDVFGGRHQWSPHFQDTFYQQPSPFDHPSRRQQQPSSFQQPRKPQQQQQYEQPKQQHQQQQRSQQQPQPQQQQKEQPEAPPKSKPILPKDPLERVALIQKDIDSLADQVTKFTGNSRTDKQYIYLDEMLTRELIKLDDIETEGRDNVRQARKNAIRTIQETISLLESKAPLPSQQTPLTEEKEEQDKQVSNDAENAGHTAESMDVDQKSENQESGTAEKTEAAETDDKKEGDQSKEPIPLPPCPSSEETKGSSTEVPNDQTNQEPSQISGEPMDTSSDEKSNPADVQQSTEKVEEKKADAAVEEQKNAENVDEEKSEEKATKGKKKKKENKEESSQEQQKDEKMEADSEVKQSPKTQKKGKKTKKQAAVSDKPIPLPAPEDTAASTK